jgi:hypothetical protein
MRSEVSTTFIQGLIGYEEKRIDQPTNLVCDFLMSRCIGVPRCAASRDSECGEALISEKQPKFRLLLFQANLNSLMLRRKKRAFGENALSAQ